MFFWILKKKRKKRILELWCKPLTATIGQRASLVLFAHSHWKYIMGVKMDKIGQASSEFDSKWQLSYF